MLSDNYGYDPYKIRMKADQAWDFAGLARMDGDREDEKRWTEEAKRLEELLRSL